MSYINQHVAKGVLVSRSPYFVVLFDELIFYIRFMYFCGAHTNCAYVIDSVADVL